MNRVFLLGGSDLEMQEIRKLLEQNNQKFIDKNLKWGARLSHYKDEINDYDEFIGIELQRDILPPANYIEIDHHGENSHKKSSLEQVADLLEVSLNRWHSLVAANDTRYIEGLKTLGATPQEIEKIRHADRVAQGVTPEDEKLAQDSLASTDSYIIYSKTPHFSTVSDRIYDKFTHYIIYNENKVLFYGFSIEKLLLFLEQKQTSAENYYYGGGDFGFFGIKENVLSSDEIKQLIKEFAEMERENKNVISYHTFMLPFTFEGEFSKEDNWHYKPFEITKSRDYNEYVYFYKHVQEAIYNIGKERSDAISNYYEYHKEKGSFVIECEVGNYELELDGISLRIFNTNVAILSFNLLNRDYDQEKDILAINDFGRRIYPQFLSENFSLKEVKEAFLANEIILRFDDGEEFREDFCSLSKKKNLDIEKLSLLPNYIRSLVGDNFNPSDNLRPIIDDRMFVISQYNNDVVAKHLKKYDKINGYIYESSNFWYKYLFVDGKDKTCQSKHMMRELIKTSTYDRWVEYGTLFGVSRYSFVALTDSQYGRGVLFAHMQTIYFQIFTLLLAYRATIIKFSDEIQNVTEKEEAKLTAETQKIYKKYLNFLNKLYFKEVTAQDQGIELYNKAMQVMDIPKYMTDLDNEMNELHAYVDMQEEKKRNKKLDNISLYGGVLLGASVLTGVFGMNVGSDDNFSWLLVVPSIAITVWVGYLKFIKKEHYE